MKKTIILFLSALSFIVLTGCGSEDNDNHDMPIIPSGPVPGWVDPSTIMCEGSGYSYDYESLVYDLVWSDEFEGDSLDTSKWTYKTNSGNYNNELQYYTDRNVTVSDGIMSINAFLESDSGYDYTSARIRTQGKGDWTYGIFEIKAKLPKGVGTWPAIWMKPSIDRYGGWPNSGEIDIMEHVGFDLNEINGGSHSESFNWTLGTQKKDVTNLYQDVTDVFHIYKLEWLPDKLIYYVDDVAFYTFDVNSYSACFTTKEWPFNDDFYIILNLAIGGSWGGQQGVDDSIFPVSIDFDYVRVYQSTEITNLIQESEK